MDNLKNTYKVLTGSVETDFNENDWEEILSVMKLIKNAKKTKAITKMEEQRWWWPGGLQTAYYTIRDELKINRIPFKEDMVKEYLDDCIKKWESLLKKYKKRKYTNKINMAVYYIDAFQSMRISLFGKALKDNES